MTTEFQIGFLIQCDISSQDPPGTVHGSPLKHKQPNTTLLLFLCGSNNSLSHQLLGRKSQKHTQVFVPSTALQ